MVKKMIKKLLVGLVLTAFVSSCFAGYSSGGRAGFSSSSRSSSSSARSYGRSGYSSSTNTISRNYAYNRNIVRPRTYSSAAHSNTVIHNNHYSHGGYGASVNGFFSGMLGGYIGGSLANNHHTTVVAGGAVAPVTGGQGMLMEGAPAILPAANPIGSMIGVLIAFMFAGFLIWLLVVITKHFLGSNQRNRW